LPTGFVPVLKTVARHGYIIDGVAKGFPKLCHRVSWEEHPEFDANMKWEMSGTTSVLDGVIIQWEQTVKSVAGERCPDFHYIWFETNSQVSDGFYNSAISVVKRLKAYEAFEHFLAESPDSQCLGSLLEHIEKHPQLWPLKIDWKVIMGSWRNNHPRL
jgi:hypothetical protein